MADNSQQPIALYASDGLLAVRCVTPDVTNVRKREVGFSPELSWLKPFFASCAIVRLYQKRNKASENLLFETFCYLKALKELNVNNRPEHRDGSEQHLKSVRQPAD